MVDHIQSVKLPTLQINLFSIISFSCKSDLTFFEIDFEFWYNRKLNKILSEVI